MSVELRPGPNVDWSSLGMNFMPPVVDGLEYWGWFGGNAAKSRKNHAPGKADGIFGGTGTPVFHDGYMSVDGDTSWLDSLVAETASITILFAGRATGALTTSADNQAESAYFVSNRADKSAVDPARNSNGISIYSLRSDQIQVHAQAWNGSALVSGNTSYALNPMAWSFFDLALAATGPLSHNRVVRDKTQNFEATATSPTAREPNIRPLRFGDSASLQSGTLDLAFGALYSRALTAEEKDACYAVVKRVKALPAQGSITL